MIDPTNLAGTAKLTFADEFNGLSLWNGSSGVWSTAFWYDNPVGSGSTLASNGEQQWYINDRFAPTQDVRPWAVQNGLLTITATPASDTLQSLINGYDYASGELNSYHSFSQQYGYFEISAQLPAGQGLWPAFWLVPADGSWPPEIDIFEVLGNDPTKLYTTVHTAETGSHTSSLKGSTVADVSAGFHTYGVNWTAEKITFYFDHQAVFETATRADLHKAMYMIVNLAVGGYWPGNPDSATSFPAQLKVDYIHAYSDANSAVAAPVGTTVIDGRTVYGSGADVFLGDDRSDVVGGGDGNDQLRGGGGFDNLNGNAGWDTVEGGDGDDWVLGGKDPDVVNGQGGNDFVHGNLGNDTLDGGAGADTMYGGQGEDIIFGGTGDDWISPDRGYDTVTAGQGADTIYVFNGSNRDVVLDFSAAEGDRVRVESGAAYSYHQQGADVLVDLGGGSGLVLSNVQLSGLPSDWIFQV